MIFVEKGVLLPVGKEKHWVGAGIWGIYIYIYIASLIPSRLGLSSSSCRGWNYQVFGNASSCIERLRLIIWNIWNQSNPKGCAIRGAW